MLGGSDIEDVSEAGSSTAESEPHGKQASIQSTRMEAAATKMGGDRRRLRGRESRRGK